MYRKNDASHFFSDRTSTNKFSSNYFTATTIVTQFMAKILTVILINWQLNLLNESSFAFSLLVTSSWHYK